MQNNLHVIFGGLNRDSRTNSNDVFACDLITNQWRKIPSQDPPSCRDDFFIGQFESFLVLFAGTKSNEVFYDDVYIMEFEPGICFELKNFAFSNQGEKFYDFKVTSLNKKEFGVLWKLFSIRMITPDLSFLTKPYELIRQESDTRIAIEENQSVDLTARKVVQLSKGIEDAIRNRLSHFHSSVLDSFFQFIYSGICELRAEEHQQQLAELLRIFGVHGYKHIVHSREIGETLATTDAFSQDLESLYLDNESKDFIILVGNVSVPVHKFILAARSGLYRNMFESVEDSSNSAPDFSGRTVKSIESLLRFLYTDSVAHISEKDVAVDLIDADEYYQLFSAAKLQQRCVSILVNSLNQQNAFELFDLAISYQVVKLRDAVISFLFSKRDQILTNLDNVVSDWKGDLIFFIEEKEKEEKEKKEKEKSKSKSKSKSK
ncbi:hypothetical protein M0811_06575 [Anaeramoeba ignava]|uniref:BTB domain-containing protein n=1 Tax=Anaeramoeba ignava TaxID=1746090 RepID=A0A9Q0LQN2_ANAIG|nr:hypothetical protein M0811_06575 [Anaeramoeba ignava]